jgi:EAL domain-containing protein (putative c-di-GMP-specific phosphodiesterase class I)
MIDKVLAEVSKEEKFDNVPQWFINAIPMKTIQTKSEISNWKTQAIVYVSANAGVAYEKLYEQAKGAIYYAIISFVIAFSILVIFLRFILKPLKEIEQLSEDISQGDFKTIDNLPWTTELRNVSISMNDMSNKIKNMINKLNANLEKSTAQLSKDDLTSLQLEQTFQTDMKQMFIKKHEGYVFSIKINDLGDFSKLNSHTVVDKFLKAFAKILEDSDKDIKAYRFFGSTFAMISRKTELKDIEKITQNLKTVFGELGKEYNIVNVANIGATPFNPISTTDAILAQANESYELSKQVGANEASIRDKNDLARDMQVWKELIFDIIDNSKFKVGYINQVLSMDGQKNTIMEEAFTSATDKDGKNIPIGTFISIAEKYNKVIDFDKAVINRVIRHISQDGITHNIHINLAFDSLLDNNFKHWLKDTLAKSQSIASQLVFSVTAYGCVRDIESFKKFALETRENGAKIILKRFETKFIPSDTLKDFNLDYIRLAREYTSGIANDSTKQNIVESICEISKLFKIEVLAESVKDDESFEKLKELGLFGASK